ncbi:hypothetical protein [Microbulbifer sp. SSSA005]|uniref:hypothetical protein n=1 Tax=Microbulbifer sp. SSSA005 TaxID=3243378 RepID=UPI004039543C
MIIVIFMFFYAGTWLLLKWSLQFRRRFSKFFYFVFCGVLIWNIFSLFKYGMLSVEKYDLSVSTVIQLFMYAAMFAMASTIVSEKLRSHRE